jgi:galactokinase
MGANAVAQRVAYTGDAMGTTAGGLADAFQTAFGRPPSFISVAPGRVNLIGEHTDYNGGFVLPVAIDRSVVVAAAPRDDHKVRVFSARFEARDDWRVDSPRRTGRAEWRDYVRGIAWALLDAGHELRGVDLLIDGDVPLGAGLSSSAALEVAVAGAFCAVSGVDIEADAVAMICQKAENQFVGVQCGIMDQLVAACGRAGHALFIDCRSRETEYVPLPLEQSGAALIIVDSKVPRRLEETEYNRRREECFESARALGVESLRDADPDGAERLPEPLNRRARHVLCENGRVLEAVDALQACDLSRLGGLMNESHESLRSDFDVSCAELDLLVDLAREAVVLGSRLTGAGFGGCTVNLVRDEALGRFRENVVERYIEQTGLPAEMFVCRASDGLLVTRA